MIYAGIDHDAFSEWDTQLWFAEGEPGLQVDALRHLIAPAAWKAPPPVHGETKHCLLLQAILDSRKGQNELSAILGERVRQAVELLIRQEARGTAMPLIVEARRRGVDFNIVSDPNFVGEVAAALVAADAVDIAELYADK